MKNLYKAPFAGEKLFEYLLIIPIGGALQQRVGTVKLEFSTSFGCKKAPHAPHLTLVHFLQFESMDFRMVNHFEKFAQFVKPLSIDFNGFGEFPSHTIYIKVESPATLKNMVTDMRSKFQKLLQLNHLLKPSFITHPHLTIARGMTETQFHKAWPTWQKEPFVDSFIANDMLLIKREVDSETLRPVETYKQVKQFPFRGKTRDHQLKLAF